MKKSFYLVTLIFVAFFVISFLTNILGAINPNVSDSFQLSGTMTGLLPFSFFIAYALMSIPSGMFVQRFHERKSFLLAWGLGCAGALLFSLFPSFPVFLLSLFLIGCGMAMLQVILYPLLRVAGGERKFAFNSVVAQLVFGLGSAVSPMVYVYLNENVHSDRDVGLFTSWLSALTSERLPWVSIYWIFAMICLAMTVIFYFVSLPEFERNEEERAGAWAVHLNLIKRKEVLFFFFGIFSYVGVEQGIANWIVEFLRTYHHVSPDEGAYVLAMFWTLMTVGCVVGMFLLRIMESKKVLRAFTVLAIATLLVTLLGNETMAILGSASLGFCLSVMYGIIFSLALNSVTHAHGSFSGILCTGIAGGAVISLLIGKLKDVVGLQWGMLFLLFPLTYVLTISYWARPLLTNKQQKDDPLNRI